MHVESVNNLYCSVAEIKVNPDGFMNCGCCTLHDNLCSTSENTQAVFTLLNSWIIQLQSFSG